VEQLFPSSLTRIRRPTWEYTGLRMTVIKIHGATGFSSESAPLSIIPEKNRDLQ
jgi:hypothetical protein